MQRISFSEITKPAVERAIAAPRAIDQDLVEAYIGRISADYLLGFSVSPMLWKKLPGARSAGRVQSVALRLVCDREAERDMHESVKFFTAIAHLDGTPHCDQVCASLLTACLLLLPHFATRMTPTILCAFVSPCFHPCRSLPQSLWMGNRSFTAIQTRATTASCPSCRLLGMQMWRV